jgi:hypothetical protein
VGTGNCHQLNFADPGLNTAECCLEGANFMPQSNVVDGQECARIRRKHALLWFGIIALLFGVSSWILSRPPTAVVVTIDEIGVDGHGVVTVTWSPQVRRDAMILHGCADMTDPLRSPEPLEQGAQGMGLLQRWRSSARSTTSIRFPTTHPESVELLVEKGRRHFLRHGDTLPLVRADREYEGRVVRHEMYVAVTPP